MVPIYPPWLRRCLSPEGSCVHWSRKAGACSLLGVVGWCLCRACTWAVRCAALAPADSVLLSPLSLSPPLITPPLEGEKRAVFLRVAVSVPCALPAGCLCFSTLGKEKNNRCSSLSAPPSPRRASGGSLWAPLGSCLGPPGGGPRGAGPCGWRGSLKGEEWVESCRGRGTLPSWGMCVL